jgi:hypothetical protein
MSPLSILSSPRARTGRVRSERDTPPIESLTGLSTRQFIELAYALILARLPDDDGLALFSRLLDEGTITREQLVKHHLIASPEFVETQWKTASPEFRARRFLSVLHQARVQIGAGADD